MATIIGYRLRDTGEVLSERALRQHFRRVVSLPASRHWTQATFDTRRFDPVYASDKPQVDSTVYLCDGSHAVRVDGKWVQKWQVRRRHESVDGLREALIAKVRRVASARRGRGIRVDGTPVRTDPQGLAHLALSASRPKSSRKFVAGNQVRTLSADEIDRMQEAADEYLQGCYDREAELIEAIRASDDPAEIEISAGWPKK